MSTNDVPGARKSNADELAMGCWAEHEDGSLIFVESTEGGRVIYSIFDVATRPIMEYRDSMADGAFKRTFSYSGKNEKWTWHDKTPFPWDRVIREGGRDGSRIADVEEHLSEAERIRRQREERRAAADNAAQRARRGRELNEGHEVDLRDIEHRIERTMGKAGQAIVDGIQQAIKKLRPARGRR